jgi:hypothetical protein
MIAYHGQLSAIVDSMRLAWPAVKFSSDIVPWGIDEFCTRALSYELLHFADHTPEPAIQDAGLLERLTFYSEIEPELIAANLACLTSRNGKQWTINDFVLSPPRRYREEEDEEEEAIDTGTNQPSGEMNLYHLTLEFIGYIKCVEGVPYAKGELGRRELHRFILERHEGRLEYRESMLQSATRDIDRKKGRRSAPKRKYRRYEHMLIPDPERLEHFLAGLLDMMNQLYHRSSAFFEIIPAWLRFLQMRRLISAQEYAQTLHHLAPLAESFERILKNYTDDPAPHRALDSWRKKNVDLQSKSETER